MSADSRRLWGDEDSEQLYLTPESWAASFYDPARIPPTVTEFSVHAGRTHLPPADVVAEWVAEWFAENGMIDEHMYERDVDHITGSMGLDDLEHALTQIGERFTYRMADRPITTWETQVVDGRVLVSNPKPRSYPPVPASGGGS